MREKITLEKFRELREKFFTELKKFEQLSEEHKDLYEEDEDKFIREYGSSIFSTIKEIISYDLSEIPFAEWKDISLVSLDEPLDLSATHANIDFNIIDSIESPLGVNLKGCNVRNVNRSYLNLSRDSFDEKVVKDNPTVFLSPLFDNDFEKKYINNQLEISDLLALSDEQIKELSSKTKKNYLNYTSKLNTTFNNIINYFGLTKALSIYKENPEYINELSIVIENITYYNYGPQSDVTKEEAEAILKIESISQMMDKVDEYVSKLIITSYYQRTYNLSNRFKTKYPNLFINENELPPDVYERFNKNSLTVEDYVKYYSVFSKGDFFNHIGAYYFREIRKLIGSENFSQIIAESPFLFLDNTLNFDFSEDYDFFNMLTNHINNAPERGITNPKDIFYLTVVERYYNNQNLLFGKATDSSIYGEAKYPEWIKKIGIYLQGLNVLDDNYFYLLTPSTTLATVNDQRLIDSLGLNNLIRFQDEYGSLGKNLDIISKYYSYNVDEPVTTYEEFLNRLANLFRIAFRNQYYEYHAKIVNELPETFTSKYPDIFLSKIAPEDLQNLYYTNKLSFQSLRLHPEWQPFLKNIKLTDSLSTIQPTLTSSDDHLGLLDYLYSIGASDKVNEYIWSYGNLLDNITINITSLDNLTLEELDDLLIEAIYNNIINKLDKKYTLVDATYDEELSPKFKNKHPELFLNLDAPAELKNYFYAGSLSLNKIKEHPEWLPYLEGKTLFNFMDIPKRIGVVNSEFSMPQMITELTFQDIYTKKYGLKALLDFLAPYSSISHLFRFIVIDVKDDSKEGLERSIEKSLYSAITHYNLTFSEDVPESFKQEHPDIFLPANTPQELKSKFYNCSLNYDDLCKHPEYIEYLKGIKFSFAFRGITITNNHLNGLPDEIAYKLVSIFGNYIKNDPDILVSLKELKNFDQTDINTIKDKIVTYIKEGRMSYSDDVPEFIKQEIPHMFLSPDAPEDLKYYYYYNPNYNISFTILKNHPEWQPFLQDKSILPFYYNSPYLKGKNIDDFITRLGGEKQFLKLGNQKPADVDYMINNNKLELLEKWYLKTGKKFIPSYVVMTTIPFEDADKFLANGKSWSTLMRCGNFKKTREGIDALIKLAYSFGIFEGDPRAEKRLLSLINDLPRNLTPVAQNTIFQMEKTILRSFVDPEATKNNMLIGLNEYKRLREVMQKEGFDISENEPVLPLIYNVGEDRQCRLIINEQQYPETAKWVRNFMEANDLRGMISPQIAHTLFGGFTLKYDPEFREFLLKNIDEILANPDYMTYVAAIQKQFTQIKIDNSNRALTLKLAVDYVQSNKYINVEIGNEELARVSAIAGYTQNDFDTLQQIFNYGKLRTFSSIPRISSSNNEYTYEITRLMDAFPIAAGTLSDCCQEIGNCAELDMEHSMTSKHGRLFVIRDELGKISAQSWVWRNQNVLCFDNVEVPDRAFERAEKEKHLSKAEFAKIIFDIYVKAAEELIATDEAAYKKLLDEGKITEEQYNSLKLSKVTVGLGYNDIATAINKYAKKDEETPKLPPKYEAPVPLQRPLYISDSRTQYILSEKEGHIEPTDTETPTIHYDVYQEYDKNNINSTVVKTLKHLEVETSNRQNYQLNCDIDDEENAFSELAYNYGVNADYLRLIVTPNFAIIYEETPSNINILDLLVKTKIDYNNVLKDVSKEVYLQMKLAFLQLINKGKQIDTSRMLSDVTTLYNTIDSLSPDFDEERGISHGTR